MSIGMDGTETLRNQGSMSHALVCSFSSLSDSRRYGRNFKRNQLSKMLEDSYWYCRCGIRCVHVQTRRGIGCKMQRKQGTLSPWLD